MLKQEQIGKSTLYLGGCRDMQHEAPGEEWDSEVGCCTVKVGETSYVEVIALDTEAKLFDEARAMHHHVDEFVYVEACVLDRLRLFSLRADDQRSTLCIAPDTGIWRVVGNLSNCISPVSTLLVRTGELIAQLYTDAGVEREWQQTWCLSSLDPDDTPF
ncbi:hypothetical protein BDI4_660064 [Burkholderia diffusa]|uniref:hypothetical protein n=1 Tax=Burkholderia diffusa TaxID=488732 RepID=UPI001CB33370|nr:hypothetical protein [Burkholderia diffusa]CAG9261057.1 hypothetical protein BDI4_660064 [Burkholderia diffusa]